MRCLWLARYMPYPADAGAKVYSAKLAESLAAAGMPVRFLGFGDNNAAPAGGAVEWVGVPSARRNEIVALFSRLPNAAAIDFTQGYRRLLEQQLEEHWDAIVLDGYGSGWALDRCLHYCHSRSPRPVLVHVSHNHETALWRSMVRQAQTSLPRRMALWQNAFKVRALEQRIVRNVDLLSTITDEDRAALLAVSTKAGAPRALTLTPGYSGEFAPPHSIDAATPRRVAIVGSFHWVMKQENLRRFVEIADPQFARHGIQLDVIGDVPQGLLATLKAHTRATHFHGYVDDVAPYMAQSRMAIVPELIGGGFKLKFLDYIFERVPVASLADATAGLPQELRRQMVVRPDLNSLVAAIVAGIDDFEQLNRCQEGAAKLAHTLFRWQDRGTQLRQAIAQIRQGLEAQPDSAVPALKRLSASTSSR